MASYGGLKGILTGLTKSTDHPSSDCKKRPSRVLHDLEAHEGPRSCWLLQSPILPLIWVVVNIMVPLFLGVHVKGDIDIDVDIDADS